MRKAFEKEKSAKSQKATEEKRTLRIELDF